MRTKSTTRKVCQACPDWKAPNYTTGGFCDECETALAGHRAMMKAVADEPTEQEERCVTQGRQLSRALREGLAA